MSSRATRSERTIASSKFPPCHGVKATKRFFPKLKTPSEVAEPSARIDPSLILSPTFTIGRCEIQVD